MYNARDIFTKFKAQLFKKNDDKPRTALNSMNAVLEFINFFANITGMEIKENWRVNRRLGFTVFISLVSICFGIYSVYISFPSADNIAMIGGFAFNAMTWAKLISLSYKHEKFMSVVRYIFNVFSVNASGLRERILMDVTKTIRYNLKVNATAITAGCAFYSAYPLYDFIFNGNLTLVSPLVLPYIDPTNLRGYFITLAYNIFAVGLLLSNGFAVTALFIAFVNTYDGLVSLLEHDFGMFDDMWLKKKCRKTYGTMFRNLMMELSDLARLNSYLNDLYNIISTVQVAMSYLVVVSCLAAFLAFDYVSGVGAAATLYTEMLMYCYIGQLLDNTNHRIAMVICNAKWYTYDVKYQKDMLTALYIAQNMEPIRLANIYPLNFDTGLRNGKMEDFGAMLKVTEALCKQSRKCDTEFCRNKAMTNQIYTLIMFMLEMFN